MKSAASPPEPTIRRRVFDAWSIEIPATFDETFVEPEGYWHAWEKDRSVSLSSFLLAEANRPVDAERILRQVPPLDGLPVDELPDGLLGRAATCLEPEPAGVSQHLAGMLAMDGRLLMATITAHDLAWCRRTWMSIRGHDAPLPPPGRTRTRGRRTDRH